MLAVVLCPGPSLARLSAVPACDLSISVNRAALRFATDIWAATDWPLVRDFNGQVLGKPILLTRAETGTTVWSKHRWTGQIVTIESWWDALPKCSWSLYTTPTAIAYASVRGATRIEVYGADMMGTADYDGVLAGENRSDTRWQDERIILDRLYGVLKERGTEVVHL